MTGDFNTSGSHNQNTIKIAIINICLQVQIGLYIDENS